MGNALLAGVSGLKAHQKMLDVAGNNLANVNTAGFKASRVTFSELLSETLREASEATATTGGTNPIQVGSGVGLASVDRVMTQGTLLNTGRELDMAIEGEGYFVLSSGQGDVYSRVGSFAIDSNNYLVDPTTGYRVQRLGYTGVAEGFQDPADMGIRVPYDKTLKAKPTENVVLSGNLAAGATTHAQQNVLSSGVIYSQPSGPVNDETLLENLGQAHNLSDGDVIRITGTNRAGEAVSVDFTIELGVSTIGHLLNEISSKFDGSTAALVNGQIVLADDELGFSRTNINMKFIPDSAGAGGSFELPTYFRLDKPGGDAVYDVNIQVFDSQGVAHELAASFVRTNDANTWDLVVKSITGDVSELRDRRINDITFLPDGSFGGLTGATPDRSSFEMVFGNDPTNPRTITVNMGTAGKSDGLTSASGGTAISTIQDGYAAGRLSALTVTAEGILTGQFTNGLRQEIAAIKLAVFQNPAGLTSIGNNYFQVSGNSGNPGPATGMQNGAGAIRGGTLEESNVDVATEFVNLIQAQNGYQANARTITVANEMLQQLSNLIR